MGKPGMKLILVGLIVMLGGYFLKGTLEEWGPGYLYYAVEVIGLGAFLFGLLQFFKAKGVFEKDSDDHIALRNEVLLNTLARLTYADSNTKAIEVSTVRKIYKKDTGQKITDAQIRVAARGDLHETKAFKNYLASKQKHLTKEDKCFIMEAMTEVVKADGSISPGEVEFFDTVGKAFKLSPSEIAELRK